MSFLPAFAFLTQNDTGYEDAPAAHALGALPNQEKEDRPYREELHRHVAQSSTYKIDDVSDHKDQDHESTDRKDRLPEHPAESGH